MKRVVRILAVAVVVSLSLQTFSDNKADVDLWGNVGFVTALPSSPEFHRTNTFSFTEPGHAWVNHEWLSEYLLHLVYDRLGDTGLLFLKVLIGLAVVLLMSRSMRLDDVSPAVRFLFLLLVISTMAYGFSMRPHLFTYLLYAVFLFLLRHHAHRPAVLVLLLPLLGLVWTNLHGAFFIGLVLLALFIVLEGIRQGFPSEPSSRVPRSAVVLGGAFVLFLLLTFVNPYGAGLWSFIFRSAAKPRPYLSEWAPFNPLSEFATHPDFMALALVSVLAVLFSTRKRNLTWITILALSFIAACWMRRNIPLFAITAAFVVPAYADGRGEKPLERLVAKVPAAVSALVLALAVLTSAWFGIRFNKTAPTHIEVPPNRFPSEIVSFMQETKLSGHALVFFDWAEYCIWKLHPRCTVFLDGRFNDAYSEKVIDDYFRFIYREPGWETVLTTYPVDIVLLHTGNSVYRDMLLNQDWTLVCSDSLAGLFVKRSAHTAFLTRFMQTVQTGEIHFLPPEKEVLFP